MGQALYPIEQIGQLAGQRARQRIGELRDILAPPGERPPFTTHLTRQQAIGPGGFWRQHRYDDLGKKVLGRWTPQQIAELDAELARAVEAERLGMEVMDDGVS